MIRLFIFLTLSLFIDCSGDDDDKEIDCEACISAQITLCEAIEANNCKPNAETDKLKQKVIDLCPDGSEKAKYIQLRCWRVDNLECSAQGFYCEK